MRPLPPAPSAPPPDRTTLWVRLGLIALAIVGVLSIFGEPLLGLGAPEIGATTPAAPPEPEPEAPASTPASARP